MTEAWDVMECYAPLYPDQITKSEPRLPEEHQSEPGKTGGRDSEEGAGFYQFRSPNPRHAEQKLKKAVTLKEQLEALNERQLKIIGVMDRASMHVDDIIDLTQLPASVVLSELTMLQIKGFVTQEQGKRFTLNISK